MKALKCIISSLILVTIAVIVGCSDNLTSPIISNSDPSQQLNLNRKNGDSFSAKFSLQPGEQIFLDSNVTSLRGISSYEISNCVVPGKTLFISTSIFDPTESMECSGAYHDYLYLPDLLIENISNVKITIGVFLKGVPSDN